MFKKFDWGIISPILGFIPIPFAFTSLFNDGEQSIWLLISLILVAVLFITYSIFLKHKCTKRTKYIKIFESLNRGYYYLHSIDRLKGNKSKEIVENLSKLCTYVAESFESIYNNKHHVGVCIKILSSIDNKPTVITLVRDEKSKKDRKTGSSDSKTHWLSENSDFDFIYSNINNPNSAYFYEKNLPLRSNYKNTRLDCEWPPNTNKHFPIGRRLEEKRTRLKKWPLQYRSTLVVPILPLYAHERGRQALRGFLCIDSPKTNTFNTNIDVNILAGLSDAIYNKLDNLKKVI